MITQMNQVLNPISTQYSANSDLLFNSRQGRPSLIPITNQASPTTGSTNSDSATISSNDFLTLLVTEMKNQDPTANTDPNEYINQLVQVNSLEQLISINQTLSADSTATTAGDIVERDGSEHSFGSTTCVPIEEGNLSAPKSNPAALSVAQALHVHQSRL